MKFKIIQEYRIGWQRNEQGKIAFQVLVSLPYAEKAWKHAVSDLLSMEEAIDFCRKYKDAHKVTDIEV